MSVFFFLARNFIAMGKERRGRYNLPRDNGCAAKAQVRDPKCRPANCPWSNRPPTPPKKPKKTVTKEQQVEILNIVREAERAGQRRPVGTIMAKYDVGKNYVSQMMSRLDEKGTVARIEAGGRPQVFGVKLENLVLKCVKKGPESNPPFVFSSPMIAQECVRLKWEVVPTAKTVERMKKKLKIVKMKVKLKPLLSAKMMSEQEQSDHSGAGSGLRRGQPSPPAAEVPRREPPGRGPVPQRLPLHVQDGPQDEQGCRGGCRAAVVGRPPDRVHHGGHRRPRYAQL